MSNMIMCDGCKKMKTDKNWSYYSFSINDHELFHLCQECYETFRKSILHQKWSGARFCWVDDEQELTGQEAIEILKNEVDDLSDRRGSDYSGVTAMNLAIKALEKQVAEKSRENRMI